MCSVYNVHYRVYIVECTESIKHCTVYSVYCKAKSIHYTTYKVHRKVCTLNRCACASAQGIPHFLVPCCCVLLYFCALVFCSNSVLCPALSCSGVFYWTVLILYLDKRKGVQENTSTRSKEFPRAQPKGTPETKCWYFPVLPDLSQGTDIIQFLKVMKL